MFKGRSKVVFVCALISTLYLIYIISYFVGINADVNDTAEAVGAGFATVLVLPHMLLLGLGVIFNWVGFGTKKNGFILAGAILYCVSALLFFIYAVFLIPSIVLGFVGYSKQKKINKEWKEKWENY